MGIVIILIGGYFVVQNNFMQRQTPKTIEKLSIAVTDGPTYALVYIAKNKGYFAQEGLNVSFKHFPKGLDGLTDVLAGNSDLAISNETPVVRKIYEGGKLGIITTLHTSTKNAVILARKDKGILTAKDLIGKKIGVTKGSSLEFFLSDYLVSQGIKLSGVTLLDIPFTELGDSLKSGKVDAISLGTPFVYDAQLLFSKDSLSIFSSDLYRETSLISGKEDVLASKKEPLLRLVKALVKAENLYKTNNKEAQEAVIAELPKISKENIVWT